MNEIKQLVARTFAELGAKDVFNLRETLFLERGRCLAVAYRADELSAVWCCADGNVEIHHAEGSVLRTLSLPKEEMSSSGAA